MLAHVQGKISDRRLRLFAAACCRRVWGHLELEARRSVESWERWLDLTPARQRRTSGALAHARDRAAGRSPHNLVQNAFPGDPASGAANATHWLGEMGVSGVALAALLREIVGNPFAPPPCKWEVRKEGPALVKVTTGPGWEETVGAPWLTAQVQSLALAAYEERAGRACSGCGGKGIERYCDAAGDMDDRGCPDCKGAGRIGGGTLDPVRLMVLADACEEAGCTEEALLRHLRGEEVVPNLHLQYGSNPPVPLAWRKKSPPCVRGCWAIDLITGRA